MLVKILKTQFHENLLTFLTVVLRLTSSVEYPLVMMSEDTDVKLACGHIGS